MTNEDFLARHALPAGIRQLATTFRTGEKWQPNKVWEITICFDVDQPIPYLTGIGHGSSLEEAAAVAVAALREREKRELVRLADMRRRKAEEDAKAREELDLSDILGGKK